MRKQLGFYLAKRAQTVVQVFVVLESELHLPELCQVAAIGESFGGDGEQELWCEVVLVIFAYRWVDELHLRPYEVVEAHH